MGWGSVLKLTVFPGRGGSDLKVAKAILVQAISLEFGWRVVSLLSCVGFYCVSFASPRKSFCQGMHDDGRSQGWFQVVVRSRFLSVGFRFIQKVRTAAQVHSSVGF